MSFKRDWWKLLAVCCVIYAIVAGFLMKVPQLNILHESIRNLYFHVTMWFGMIIILLVSLIYSIKYLSGFNLQHDIIASEAANVGILFGILGISTGSVWANFTWGDWWVNDAKLNGAAITLLFYLAYVILRSSLEEEHKRAKVSAIYNIFAYVLLIVFLLILPRMTDSLHPGNGGNPGFGQYDLDSNMRLVFYPAIIGWTLLGVWMMNLGVRIKNIKLHNDSIN
ncbi:MAG: cytochrome c biogenesis protein CcsA [Bacteroidia bacterium]|nr:cytochrome c biogenesis protein CcsA [Bacteroidota bacterium]MBP6413641.1 cytochrome c biogenesis protein CcsA [Bacteroidia bacterium]